MVKIGLTGGMGSGKSTLLRWFRDCGWFTLDADAIVRGLLEEDSEVIESIRVRFGPEVADRNEGVKRKALAAAVFGDDTALTWLEKLLHPRVRGVWLKAMQEVVCPVGVVEIPLLFEKNLENHFDLTVAIYTTRGVRLKRLDDSGVSPETAEPRMRRQLPSEVKAKRADFVIINDGSITFLQDQAAVLRSRVEREYLS